MDPSPTFNRLDIILKLGFPKLLRLEPVRQDELAPRLQHLARIVEEQGLVGKVTERLADPHGVELSRIARKEVAHPLGVQLDEPDLAPAQGPEPAGISSHGILLAALLLNLCLGKAVCDMDLLAGDGDARHGAPPLGGEVARSAADAASDVEDVAVFGEARGLEEKADQVDLGGFLGVGGFGLVGGPVAVVDVFAPGQGKWVMQRGMRIAC